MSCIEKIRPLFYPFVLAKTNATYFLMCKRNIISRYAHRFQFQSYFLIVFRLTLGCSGMMVNVDAHNLYSAQQKFYLTYYYNIII